MDISAVLAVSAPLAGVVIGACGSLGAQAMWARATRAQTEVERSEARRSEQKKALGDFLEAAQAVERVAQHRFSSGEVRDDADTTSNHMWLMQKFVDIIAGTAALRKATFDFAQRSSDAVWGEMPVDRDLQHYLGDLRYGFLQAARRELGVTDDG